MKSIPRTGTYMKRFTLWSCQWADKRWPYMRRAAPRLIPQRRTVVNHIFRSLSTTAHDPCALNSALICGKRAFAMNFSVC